MNFWDPTGECTEKEGQMVGLCPTEGDQAAKELVEQQLADSNSLASEVNQRATDAGERIDVTTDDRHTTAMGSGYNRIDPNSSIRAGEIVVGTQPGQVQGIGQMIDFPVEDAFEHEASHALDDLMGDLPIGDGVIEANGAVVSLRSGMGAQEARAINRTNLYRAAQGRPLRGGY